DLVAHHIAEVHPHMAVLEQVPHDLTADGIRGELYVAVHKVAIEHPHQGAPHGARAGEHDRAAGIAHALDGHLPVGGGHHRPVALHHEVSVVHVVEELQRLVDGDVLDPRDVARAVLDDDAVTVRGRAHGGGDVGVGGGGAE